ncbi:MAG: hypothetical protein ACW960_01670 [Candidatus Thorarchaeota archaeon]|jgi:hypothetical protein
MSRLKLLVILEGFLLITTFIVPIAYVELHPYSSEESHAVGWAFVFGSFDTRENRLVFYDPSYILSFGHIEYIVTVAFWIAISIFLVLALRHTSRNERRIAITWSGVIVALVSQMIFPRLILQFITRSYYGSVLALPIQSVIAVVALVIMSIPSISQWIIASTFLTPYVVGGFATATFDYGQIWNFPFWEFVQGTGEGGGFTYLRTIGPDGFLPFHLWVLTTAVLIPTGMILAEVLRRAKNDVEWGSIGPASVLAAIGIQLTAPIIAISAMRDYYLGSLYQLAIPIPIPSILAIIGLVVIRWKNLGRDVT